MITTTTTLPQALDLSTPMILSRKITTITETTVSMVMDQLPKELIKGSFLQHLNSLDIEFQRVETIKDMKREIEWKVFGHIIGKLLSEELEKRYLNLPESLKK